MDARCNPRYLDHADSYARTFLWSPAAQTVELRLGSDDGIIVWVNGEEVFDDVSNCRCYQEDQYRVNITLNQGSNMLLLKASCS